HAPHRPHRHPIRHPNSQAHTPVLKLTDLHQSKNRCAASKKRIWKDKSPDSPGTATLAFLSPGEPVELSTMAANSTGGSMATTSVASVTIKVAQVSQPKTV